MTCDVVRPGWTERRTPPQIRGPSVAGQPRRYARRHARDDLRLTQNGPT